MGLSDLLPDFLLPGPAKNPYSGMLSMQYYRRMQCGKNISAAGDFLTRAVRRRARYDLKNKSLTVEEKVSVRRQHKEWIRRLRRKMQEYSRESSLPARLQ